MKHLLISGWRGINHSFCLVNQHQILALARRGDFALSHIDLPFRMANWNRRDNSAGFPPHDQSFIDSLTPADETQVDCVLRIAAPLYPPNPKARKTVTFAITELGYERNNVFLNPNQDLKIFTAGENCLFTASRWARDRILEFNFTEGKVFVVGHGVDANVFRPLTAEEQINQRLALGIPLDAVIFLNVGVTTWNKGIDLLIRAFASVQRRYSNTRLLLKDSSDLYGLSVKQVIDTVNSDQPGLLSPIVLNNILTIPGNLSWAQLRWLYGFADWYIAPYRAEGFNLPALEAQACGTPVIVSSGGATDDFCHGIGTRRIASVFRRGILPGQSNQSTWVEPEFSALENLMLQAAAAGPLLFNDALRQAARSNALTYSWDWVANHLIQLL